MLKVAFIMPILSLMILMFSCDNEPYEGEIPLAESDIDPVIPEDFQNVFVADLNGQTFDVGNIYTTYSEDLDAGDFIAITGSESFYHSIILYLPSDITAGTYNFDSQSVLNNPNLNITYSNLQNLLESGIGDGVITIQEHNVTNHYMKGHFECTISSQNGTINEITEGRFEVVYVQ